MHNAQIGGAQTLYRGAPVAEGEFRTLLVDRALLPSCQLLSAQAVLAVWQSSPLHYSTFHARSPASNHDCPSFPTRDCEPCHKLLSTVLTACFPLLRLPSSAPEPVQPLISSKLPDRTCSAWPGC